MRRRRSNVSWRLVVSWCVLLGVAPSGSRADGQSASRAGWNSSSRWARVRSPWVRRRRQRQPARMRSGGIRRSSRAARARRPSTSSAARRLDADGREYRARVSDSARSGACAELSVPEPGRKRGSIQSDIQTGSFIPSTRILAGTFAAPFGDRLALGLTVKLLSVGFQYTGQVPNVPDTPPITGAIDAGAQYIVTKDSLFIVGASLTNLGLPLQINDAPQADPLPGRVDVGVQFAPQLSRLSRCAPATRRRHRLWSQRASAVRGSVWAASCRGWSCTTRGPALR